MMTGVPGAKSYEVLARSKWRDIDFGDIESCAQNGKLSPPSAHQHDPRQQRSASSNCISPSTKRMRMPGEKCTSRSTAAPCYTNRNVTDFMEAKREHLTNGQAR